MGIPCDPEEDQQMSEITSALNEIKNSGIVLNEIKKMGTNSCE